MSLKDKPAYLFFLVGERWVWGLSFFWGGGHVQHVWAVKKIQAEDNLSPPPPPLRVCTGHRKPGK